MIIIIIIECFDSTLAVATAVVLVLIVSCQQQHQQNRHHHHHHHHQAAAKAALSARSRQKCFCDVKQIDAETWWSHGGGTGNYTQRRSCAGAPVLVLHPHTQKFRSRSDVSRPPVPAASRRAPVAPPAPATPRRDQLPGVGRVS